MSGIREMSLEQASVAVAERLRARRREIEEAVFARICDVAFGQVGDQNAEYAVGLRAAVSAAVEFSLLGMEHGDETVSIPAGAAEQARRAARVGVSLDTVLRRYIAGHGLLADYIVQEADRVCLPGNEAALQNHLRRRQTPLLERLMAAIVEEYHDEAERVGRSPEQRRTELVLRLLAGKQPETSDMAKLDYDLDSWHTGAIATGERAAEAFRSIKTALGCDVLAVLRGEHTLWVWFGDRRRPAVADLKRISRERPSGVSVVMGESRRGVEGWRMTHQEAQAGLLVALRKAPGVTRCTDVLLEAAVLQSKTLAASLMDTFLLPLDDLRYRGQTARDTLRAYFESKRNISSTAHRLGVARNTVDSRLREIEERLGRPLHTCSAQLEVALRLDAMDRNAREDKQGVLEGRLSSVARSGRGDIVNEQSAQFLGAPLSTLTSRS
jgi:transposase-like protein